MEFSKEGKAGKKTAMKGIAPIMLAVQHLPQNRHVFIVGLYTDVEGQKNFYNFFITHGHFLGECKHCMNDSL